MKKFTALLLVVLLAMSFSACGNTAQVEGTLPEIMEKIVSGADVDADTKEYVLSRLAYTDVTADLSESFLGASYSYKEAYAAEPMVNAQALSIVLVRADSASAAKDLATEIKKTANPNKWICVGVDESNVITAYKGDLAILVMADSAQKYIDVFDAL